MRHRGPRILLLLLVTVWYAALLPGHQRGVIQLPGANAAGAHDGCCDPSKPHRPGDPAPARSPANCAVCKYMGALTIGPPPELGIAPLGPTDRQPVPLAPALVSLRSFPTYLGRAPPAV